MSTIRNPGVAGTFYPSSPDALRNMVREMLAESDNTAATAINPRALIVPHAGYIYSGMVAAQAYTSIRSIAKIITRVVVLGPAHRVAVSGMALSSADYFQTPLGTIPIDQETCTHLVTYPQVEINEQAHEYEHSLEVQLPFLQELLNEFKLIPIVVGETRPEDVYSVLNYLIRDEHTLIVVSTDLSHYENYEMACKHDRKTSQSIEDLQYEKIGNGDACGRNPLNGLLYLARKKNLHVLNLALQNSGDSAGDHDRVVGYGAYVLQ